MGVGVDEEMTVVAAGMGEICCTGADE